MFKCLECGEIFWKPSRYTESHEIGAENFACCPTCKSNDFDDLRENVKARLETLLDKNFGGSELDMVFDLFETGDVNI